MPVSVLVAILLWYTVNAREQIDRVVTVRLDYKNLPARFSVISGQISQFSVRLRGPAELLRSLSNQDIATTMDLSKLTVGNNVLPITWTPATTFRPLEVVEISPAKIILKVDEIVEKRVPVTATLRSSPLEHALSLLDVRLTPGEVTVRGPAETIIPLKKVSVEVPADLDDENILVSDTLPVLAPPAVEIVPPQVKAERRLVVSRRSIILQREILCSDDLAEFSIKPAKISALISIPVTRVNDSDFISMVQAYIKAGARDKDGKTPVEMSVPPGVHVVRINPSFVTLTSPAEKAEKKDSKQDRTFSAPF